ncbi:hypothetical protein [Streptomyces sp. NPDC002516]
MEESVRVKVPFGLATTMVPVPVSWSTVTGSPVAFARADADSVALNRLTEGCGWLP